MIHIELRRIGITGVHCSNRNCKKLPENMINILGNVYYIKVDTTVAVISMNSGQPEYYCRGCIDEVYQYMRSKLDSRLWSFQ